MSITFLHVSDLHLTVESAFDRKIVIDALIKDVRRLRSTGTSFDIVLFSGDLVMAGSDPNSFATAISEFVDPLLEAVNLSRERFFICPGNHDVSRDAIVSFIETGLKAALTSVEAINDFVDVNLAAPETDHAKRATFARMDNYEKFYGDLSLGSHVSHNVFFKTRLIDLAGTKVGVASLNSAWRATGGPADKN